MMDRAGFLQSSPHHQTRSHHRPTTTTTTPIVTSSGSNNNTSSDSGKTGSNYTGRVTNTHTQINAIDSSCGGGGRKAALIKAVQQQQHNSIGFRVNPRSPMRVNAMRERERRHLDSLNYWKREFAVADTTTTGVAGAGKKSAAAAGAQCYGIDSHNSPPALARHVGVKTRSTSKGRAAAGKIPPFPVITPVVDKGERNGKQRYTTKQDKVISSQQRREEEFAKKFSPMQNSPQFFNHQLVEANRPLSPLKSPPRQPVTLWSQCNMMAAHHNLTHHKSAFYTPAVVHCGGGGAGGYYGAGYGCHQAAAGHYVWMGPVGGHSSAFYHPVRAVPAATSTTTTVGGGGGMMGADEEEGENTQPEAEAAGGGGKVDEDEELIFAIEI